MKDPGKALIQEAGLVPVIALTGEILEVIEVPIHRVRTVSDPDAANDN